jgi:type II secretory pathway component PulJ
MSSLHHWLGALGRGLKRHKHNRRIEEEARRDRLKLEADHEQMRAEALVEVERLGMMGGRPHEMRLGTYRRHEPPKRLDESHPDEPPFSLVLPMSFDPPAAPKLEDCAAKPARP